MERTLAIPNVLYICLFCLVSWVAVCSEPAASGSGRPQQESDTDAASYAGHVPFTAELVAIVLLATTIVMLVGCADLCNKHFGLGRFVSMDNDGYTHDSTVDLPAPLADEFSMYPPIESTPTPMSSVIYFEPLPDIAGQRRPTKRSEVNRRRLRPRVAMAWNMDRDSEESLEEALKRDAAEDQTTLQNLIAHTRNQLARSQIHYIKELGNGWFGKVLQGEGQQVVPGHKKTKLVVQMLKEDATVTDRLAFLQEAQPYRDIEHSNVLKVLGQCTDSMPYLTILELCPFGDLKGYLRDHRVAMQSFNEKGLLLKFACDMAAGLIALHEFNYVHRDFAARNCLLASDLSVKIGDYSLGDSMYKDDYLWDDGGDAVPVRWLAPEAVHYDSSDASVTVGRITKASNIWSYGIVLWEVMQFGAIPYSDLSNELVLRLVVNECSVRLTKPDLPISNIDRLYELMQLCWCNEPLQRPSLRQLRIMLLHLMSNKIDTNSAAFDRKWNQLLPRRLPQVTNVAGAVTRNTPPLTTMTPGDVSATGKTGFNSEFTRLDASLLTQVGSLKSDSDISIDDKTVSITSAVNELSLEAELSALAGNRSNDSLHKTNNSLSLEQELAASSNNDPSRGDKSSPSKPTRESVITEVHRNNKAAGDTRKPSQDDSKSDSRMSLDLSNIHPSPNHALVTSTPKKNMDDSGDTYETVTQTDSTLYRTALTSQQSISQSEEWEQQEQKKFAAMLKTVTSFDCDDFDMLSLTESDPNENSVLDQVLDGEVTMTGQVRPVTEGGELSESTGVKTATDTLDKPDTVTDTSDRTDMVTVTDMSGETDTVTALTDMSDKTDAVTDTSEKNDTANVTDTSDKTETGSKHKTDDTDVVNVRREPANGTDSLDETDTVGSVVTAVKTNTETQ